MNELAQSWLTLQCQMIPGVRRAILILGAHTEGTIAPSASWPANQPDMDLLAEAGKLALQKKAPVVRPRTPPDAEHSNSLSVVACPLLRDGQLFGVVVLEIETLDEPQQHTLLQLIQWGSAWLQLLPGEDSTPAIAARLSTVIEVTAKSLEHTSLAATAAAVTTQLAQTFACDRVSFGLLESQHMRIRALSHSAQIDRRSDLVRAIEAAMDEAMDEGATLAHPPVSTDDTPSLPAHERLCTNKATGAVCTLLLSHDNETIGALTFERRDGPSFDRATVDVCDAITALLGPVFDLKRINDRSLPAKAGDAITDALGGLIGFRRIRTKLILAGLFGVTIWLGLATGNYRIGATAVLEGTEQRALVAPIDGYIKQTHARAGELVEQGDLIATLDDRDLQLERRRWLSERDDLTKKHRRAIGSFDRAEAAILEAQLGKASAQLALVEEHLARTRIVAPFGGVIVSGDLSRSLGAPVERGQILFELAPLDAYRMALQVHESDIAQVTPGQRGHLALAAMPGERLPFVVEDVIGVAETDQGQNGFRVEARLEDTTHQLRPGMRGVGKIDAGERNLLWIWSHTLLERIELWFWSHLP